MGEPRMESLVPQAALTDSILQRGYVRDRVVQFQIREQCCCVANCPERGQNKGIERQGVSDSQESPVNKKNMAIYVPSLF